MLEGSKDTATELKLPRDISVSILNSRCLIFFNADIWKRLPKMNITIKPKKYEIIDPIGSGAYGVVVAAKDANVPAAKTEGGESNLVAIKKIVKAFEHRVFSLRTYRELKIQRLLEHENVLGIKRILKPKNRESFNEIYVVSELMETDLAQIIKSN